MTRMICISLLLLSALTVSSCCRKPISISSRSDSIRIEYREKWHERVIRDTTYVRDSIMIRERNDTVIIYRDRYHYVDRFLKDTVLLRDTILREVYKDRVEVIEKRHVPRFFWWCFAIAVAAFAYAAIKTYRTIKL